MSSPADARAAEGNPGHGGRGSYPDGRRPSWRPATKASVARNGGGALRPAPFHAESPLFDRSSILEGIAPNPFGIFPWWVIVLDYVLGIVMWTLIGRAGDGLVPAENQPVLLHAVFRARDRPAGAAVPADHAGFSDPADGAAFVAWFFFMFRFYVMPWLLGYSVMGMLSFPLEGDIASGIYEIFGPKR